MSGGCRSLRMWSVKSSTPKNFFGQPQPRIIWVARAGLAHGMSGPTTGIVV